MANLIASGTTLSAWTDVTVAAGTPKAVFIMGIVQLTPPSLMQPIYELAHKASDGNYDVIGTVTTLNQRDDGYLLSPGTFGLRRLACPTASGLDVE